MNSAWTRPPSREGGFVLVGVVVFVLALTILGLSLFSLSSFEAQFLGRSTRSAQALSDAISGIEWARAVLTSERKLEAVANGQPAAGTRPPRVTWVQAVQDGDSVGAVQQGEPIRIRALAEDGRGERRMVEVQFKPTFLLYRNLIDSYEGVHLIDVDTEGDVRRTLRDGSVRLNDNSDNRWQTALPGPPFPTYAGDGVELPEVQAYLDQHFAAATEVVNPGGSAEYYLTAGGTFFKTTTPGSAPITLNPPSTAQREVEIHVSGTCVWMVRNGMRFADKFRVLGTASDRLIVVAGPSDPTPFGGVGIFLEGALDSPNVPVVLVSDGPILVQSSVFTEHEGIASSISIYGRSVTLMGPETLNAPTAKRQVLRHPPSMDQVIEELAEQGLLPNVSGAGSGLAAEPGTWRELDPDNPS